MAIAWMPKTSVPATLGGLILQEAKSRGDAYKEYQEYGIYAQTNAIIAILILASSGSIILQSLAPRLLTLDD